MIHGGGAWFLSPSAALRRVICAAKVRPLIPAALSFGAGTWIGVSGLEHLNYFAAAACAAAALAIVAGAARGKFPLVSKIVAPSLLALCFAVGAWRGRTVALARQADIDLFREVVESGEPVQLRGRVSSEPSFTALSHGGARMRFDFDALEIPVETDSIPVGGSRVRIDWYGPVSMGDERPPFPIPRAGQGWCVDGILKEIPTRAAAPLLSLRKDGRTSGSRRVPAMDAPAWRMRLWEARAKGADALCKGVEDKEDSVALLRAMVLGLRADVPEAARRSFEQSGTVHVFAISGLHVGIVAGMMLLLLRLLSIPHRLKVMPLLILLPAYVCLSGGRPSAVRACAMTLLYLAAPLFLRRPDALSALGAAALGILAVSPLQILDLGFQFSFLCTAGILVLWPAIRSLSSRVRAAALRKDDSDKTAEEDARPLLRGGDWVLWKARKWVLSALGVSVSAWLCSAPLTALCFGRLSPVAVLCNIPVIALATAAVCAASLSLACAMIAPAVCAPLNKAAVTAVDAMARCSDSFASIPGATWEVHPWSPVAVAAWFAAILLFCAFTNPDSQEERDASQG